MRHVGGVALREAVLRSETDTLSHGWITPIQLVRALRRYAWLILLCGLLFGAAAYAWAAIMLPKKFSATSSIVVETSGFAIPELQGAMSSDASADVMPLVRSEVQELSSRAQVQRVIDDLHLVSDPQFNPTLRPPSFGSQVKIWIGTVLPSWLAEPLSEVGLVILHPLSGPMPPEMLDDILVGAVSHDLSVTNDGRSMVIDLQFTSEDPQVSAQVLNHLVQRYLDEKQRMRSVANRQANTVLNQRVGQVRDEINNIEQNIEKLRQNNSLVQLRAGSISQQQLEDLSSAVTRAAADRAQLEANYARAQALAHSGSVAEDSSEVLNSATVSALRGREAAAEQRVAQLSATLGPGHPALRAAQSELASARAALSGEARRVAVALGSQAEAARQRESDLRQQFQQLQGVANGQTGVQSQLQQLEKDADARRELYQTLLSRVEQTESNKNAPQATGAHVVSAAVPPGFPSSPRPKLAGGLGLVGGFAFGGLIALWRERSDEGFEDPESLAAGTGLETLASVPRVPPRSAPLPALVIADPTSASAEALRTLRTRLRYAARGAVPRSVLFVGSRPGEGASSIAAAFARVAVQDGVRVLLVDADLQAPSVAATLGAAPQNGFVDVLEGRRHWQDALTRDRGTALELLLSEPVHDGAGQLLEAMQLQNFVAEAREDYNMIVLDGPALSTGTQAVPLAHMVDAVVLVVSVHGASRASVREAAEALAASARNRPVVVLNKTAC